MPHTFQNAKRIFAHSVFAVENAKRAAQVEQVRHERLHTDAEVRIRLICGFQETKRKAQNHVYLLLNSSLPICTLSQL